MRAIFLLLSLILAAGSAEGRTSDIHHFQGFPNSLGERDFFTMASRTPYVRPTLKEGLLSCRENIAKTVCLVDPVQNGDEPQERPCLPGSAAYAEPLESLYDKYPPTFQKMFCSLRHIFIEKDFEGTAYAGTLHDKDGNPQGAIMGIRKSVIDENLGLQTWASWKEQLSFGGITDSYTLNPDLPMIQTSTAAPVNDFLYFVVTHEFGHIFDFANGLNKTKNCAATEEDPPCDLEEGTWGAISWITTNTPRPANDFPLRNSLCFYWCGDHPLNRADVPAVYGALARTDFISLYATRQPWDDFADSLGYYLSAQNLATRYSIDDRQGQVYDIIAKLYSPLFARKREYLENFLARTDLIYP